MSTTAARRSKNKTQTKERVALLLECDGTSTKIAPANEKRFRLDEVRHLVGGWVQRIAIDANTVMLVDEDGNSKNLPVNAVATAVFREAMARRVITNPIMEKLRQEALEDFIVGKVIICDRRMY